METPSDEGDSASGLLVVFLGSCLVGFCLVLGLLVFFSPHHVVFPFPSMMTWALRPHGVRTRGKTRRRVARKHFSSRRKSECELSGKCVVRSVKSSELR